MDFWFGVGLALAITFPVWAILGAWAISRVILSRRK